MIRLAHPFLVAAALSSACAAVACGGSTTLADTEEDPGSGAASTGGDGPGGSSSGGTGNGGGAGNSGGAGATGGNGASGGVGAGGPECVDDSGCAIVNDCCACEGIPAGEPFPECPLTCFVSSCEAAGLPNPPPLCAAGQCVAGFDCSYASCFALPPVCEPGMVPSVVADCWGPCVPATECAAVASCDQCPIGTACVEQVAFGTTLHCVAIPESCNGTPSCACMGSSVCVGEFDACIDGADSISCECTSC